MTWQERPILDFVERTELILEGPAMGLAGLLGVDAGATLPPTWHWVYMLERPLQADLGPDGHPTVGIPAPPAAGMRRMFAGGRVTTHFRLRFGESATRRTRIANTTTKSGRSGALTFVTVASEVWQGDRLAVSEEQDIVYLPAGADETRRDAVTTTRPEEDSEGPDTAVQVLADETLLFRFSALTFNAHRIHYDREFAASEGYAGLVVHGPLQAVLMAQSFHRLGIDMVDKEFRYRLVAPLLAGDVVTARASSTMDGQISHVRDSSGRFTARGALGDAP
jgi:3-methylfumaryl-CoA hydratase